MLCMVNGSGRAHNRAPNKPQSWEAVQFSHANTRDCRNLAHAMLHYFCDHLTFQTRCQAIRHCLVTCQLVSQLPGIHVKHVREEPQIESQGIIASSDTVLKAMSTHF